MLTLPAITAHPDMTLVAACDPRAEARTQFKREFTAFTTNSYSDFLKQSDMEAIYITSPHQFHKEHAIAALKAGKHVLIDKPIAIDMNDSREIVAVTEQSGKICLIGPCHSFDPPYTAAAALIKSGVYGHVKMLQASYYTDFLYRPRRAEELRTVDGGGVLFSQGAHQIDIARLLCGGAVSRLAATCSSWDEARAEEGAYNVLMQFENGANASLTYSGHAHYISDEQLGHIGELGQLKNPTQYGSARKNLNSVSGTLDEDRLKRARTYGHAEPISTADAHEHFGEFLVSLEQADIRITPQGLHIYADTEQSFLPLAHTPNSRGAALTALYKAIREDKIALQSAAWGHATLEVCHAVLNASKTETWQSLKEQTAVQSDFQF